MGFDFNWQSILGGGTVALVVGGFIKYGDKILNFILGTKKESITRRVTTEDSLRKQIDELRDEITELTTRHTHEIATLNTKCTRVIDAYQEFATRIPQIVEAVEARLLVLTIDDVFLKYLLQELKRIKPILPDEAITSGEIRIRKD